MQIILCVTGSVAAVETVKLARELKRQGYKVKCFMSDGACDIINPNALEFATGEKVITKLTGEIEHVKYARESLILVAPATANVISKFAYRIADNPINTLLVTAYGYGTPIIFVPSMHESMYRTVEENVEKLKNDGIVFVEPRKEENKAKFPSIQDIVLNVQRATSKGDLQGKKVLVSAGATYEAIDPIRGITNRSSGKMGFELAKEAFRRGAEVTLICGRVEVEIPSAFHTVKVESALDMQLEVEGRVLDNDVFLSAAAVSDFTLEKETHKVSSQEDITLHLRPAPKIINRVKVINPEIFLVAFKADYNVSHEEIIQSAKERMQESSADLVVANDVAIPGAGFGAEDNQILLIDDHVRKVPLNSKAEISRQIIDRIVKGI
ncbi:MAG TPA: bifunctional phosphopantothenoylcysteine decarboxylase/phosphopantothenate--cysteine ligase CoaBC [Methanobacteriaceae archaeon]|nr:bifunctional phosphopantothenoylcysteine decarboxylase/phosphopantothenate--cysteine ligase CoaBC [Methanobacteriaceae archaeon]